MTGHSTHVLTSSVNQEKKVTRLNQFKSLYVLITAVLILARTGFPQIEFEEHIIVQGFQHAIAVYAADVDGDGDMDVLGTALHDDEISWWENDGDQNFERHIIDDNYGGAVSVFAADLDSDGDMDILGAATDDHEITWWENVGDRNFEEHVIDEEYGGAEFVFAIDLDSDGDMDVLGAASDANQITWWENDGDQQFDEHTIRDGFATATCVYAIDMDNDEDIDVLGTAFGDSEICWWENDGEQNFDEHILNDRFDAARWVYAIDLDNDDDIDVLGASRDGDLISWWENNGEQEFEEHIIVEDYERPYGVFAIDMDHDGDNDVLGTAAGLSDVSWWENDGDGRFDRHSLTDNFGGAFGVYAADIDSDGDADVLACGVNAHAIHWWENLSPTFEMIIEPDSINFGPVAIETNRSANIRIIYETENEDMPDLFLEIQVMQGENWIFVEPEEAQLSVSDTLDAELSIFVSEGEDLGQREGSIRIIPNELEGQRVDIPILAFVVEGFGTLRGTVTDAATGDPLAGVRIDLDGISFTTESDNEGRYAFEELPAWLYSVRVDLENYLPYRSGEFEIPAYEETVLNIEMLHSVCQPNMESITVELTPDSIAEVTLFICNPGNGLLQFQVERHFPIIGDAEPWELRQTINTYDQVGDNRMQGVEFDGENIYVTGGNNGDGRGLVYVFSSDGQYIRSFEQFRDSPWGMRDLAWDGELLWGADDDTIYGFTPEGELVNRLVGPLEINRALTWDDENNLFWTCDVTTDLYGIDMEGDVVERIDLPEDLHVYGLGTYPEDADEFTIYTFNKDGDYDSQFCKVNPETGELILITDIETPEELKSGGMSITGGWDPMSWVCIGVLQGRREVNDEVDIWHLNTRSLWLSTDIDAGEVPPEDETPIVVTINSEDYRPTVELEGELEIIHNGRGDAVSIPVTMRVVRVPGIHPQENVIGLPSTYYLSEPYPNPFNSKAVLSFGLPVADWISIIAYDASGREVANLVDNRITAGRHSVTWDARCIPAGIYLIEMETESGIKIVSKAVIVK